MRSMYDILRGHVNHNFSSENNIPIPSDFVIENKLDIQNINEWIQDKIFGHEELKQFNLVNAQKAKKYSARKRSYVFIMATNTYDLSTFRV